MQLAERGVKTGADEAPVIGIKNAKLILMLKKDYLYLASTKDKTHA